MEAKVNGAALILKVGDITKESTEAIVNAANSALAGGGGVDGAIHRAGGPSIMAECRKIGGCPTGQAVITGGGNLKAKFVVHAVGPIYRGGSRGEAELLRSAYQSSLRAAAAKSLKSVSFPSISTGAYGYPLQEAARIALQAVVDYLHEFDSFEEIRFVLFDNRTYDAYADELKRIAGKD